MPTQTKEKNQPKSTHVKPFLASGGGAALLLIIGCVAVWFLVFRGSGGELASASVAERITSEFVQTL